MATNDFSTPRRMSPSAFIVMFVKAVREIAGAFFFVIIYFFFRDEDEGPTSSFTLRLIVMIAAIIAFSLLTAFLRYYFRKFHIEGDKLIYTHGLAQRNTTSIPLSRIHNVRTKRGLIYRLLGMRGVTFDTLATDQQEVELILDEADWQALLARVSLGERTSGRTEPTQPPAPPAASNIKTVSTGAVIRGALCQNHLRGFAVLSAILLPILDHINDLGEDNTAQVIDYIDSYAGSAMPTFWQWAAILAAIYLVFVGLLTAKIALRYGDMAVTTAGNRLTVESGLISRFTSRLARDKATMLTIKQNPLEKASHCETIRLRQAANATDKESGGDIRIYGSGLGRELFSWWLGNSSSGAPGLSARSGRGLFMRRFLPHLAIALAATLTLVFAAQIIVPAIVIGALYTLFALVRAIMAMRHSAIILHGSYIEVRRGNIAEISEFIRYGSIEAARIRKTPFTRFFGRVTLRISTNAGSIAVRSLKHTEAAPILNQLIIKGE